VAQHPHDSTKNGITEHVSRELAAVAVGYGQAVYSPWRGYVDRLNDIEKTRGRAAEPPSWGVLDAEGPGSIVRIIKRDANGTTYFDGPQKDTPPAIVAWFWKLANIAMNQQAANSAERNRAEYEARQESERNLNCRF
jgi:hypothetical protein